MDDQVVFVLSPSWGLNVVNDDEMVGWLAEDNPDHIYFYASLSALIE